MIKNSPLHCSFNMHSNSHKIPFLIIILLPIWIFAEVGYFLPWGKDADLSHQQTSSINYEKSLGQMTANVIIEFHQSVISPADGPRSHFRPSSSTYARDAIDKYGFVKGFLLGCDRLMRENEEAWYYPKITTEEGTYKYDPVP